MIGLVKNSEDVHAIWCGQVRENLYIIRTKVANRGNMAKDVEI